MTSNKNPEWLGTVFQAIEALIKVHDDARLGNLRTGQDLLEAARSVDAVVHSLEPATLTPVGTDPSVVTSLVRAAREADVERPTWNSVSKALNLGGPQRAFDRYSEGRDERREATRERVYSQRAPKPAPVLPGISAAEAEEHYGCSRTKLRAMESKGLVHSYPLLKEDGTPVVLRRAGKNAHHMRWYPTGLTLEQAAAQLGVTEAEVKERAAGEFASAPVLNEQHQPVINAVSGDPLRWYWPDHSPVPDIG